MIWDAFPFFNEFAQLEIRCEELKGVIHILVESNLTHSGLPKPLYFQENKKDFAKYNIIHKIVDFPKGLDAWGRERFQRNYISKILNDIAQDEDTIIIADADEIPRLEKINVEEITHFVMDDFYYYLNFVSEYQGWSGAYGGKWKYLKEKNLSEERVKMPRGKVVEHAGWHFGWLGGTEKIKEKLKSFAHTELNTKDNQQTERIEDRMSERKIFWHNGDARCIPIEVKEPDLPKYVVENKEKFKHLINETHNTPLPY